MRATRAEELPLGRRVAAFAVLMVFEFFYGWSWNTVDVLRPQIRAALELTLTQAGTAYSAQSLGALVGAVVLGQLADHHGRRRTLVAIVAGYAVCGGLGAVVASYPQLLAQRFGLGFFLGGIFPVLIATYMGLFADRLRGKLAALGQGTYNVAVIALGQAYRVFGEGDGWHTLLLAGAIPPLVLLPLLLVVPDDRRVRAWGAATAPPPLARLPVVALFAPDLRRTTLLMFLLVGLNFFGYQAFAGWVTTYLKEVKHFGADVAGDVISRQFVGAVLGGFFWGWSTDRFGRRSAAWGFFIGAGAVALYLGALDSAGALRFGGALWGFAITSSVAWAPWMSVLFPAHLRSTAMSIFNWGRLISFTAPPITGLVAERFGLASAMALSAVSFALGGVVWLLLPERGGAPDGDAGGRERVLAEQ